MAQPRDYTRQYNFSDYQATSPSDPLPGSQIDAELNTVKLTLDDLNANIAKIQRDDGKIGNATVHKDAFDQAALALINSAFTPRGDWSTATSYAVNDAVDFNGATYVATIAHTSSAAFATDDGLDRWILIANAAISGTGSAVDKFEGDGSTTAFTLSYNYTTETAVQVFVNGELLNPVDDYTLSGTTLTLFTAPGLPVVAGNENVIVWGASVVAQAAAADASGHESNASGYADESQSWASKTNGIVESTDYSSKAWATGGTGVDTGSGSAKDWATKTSGTVGNTTEYSSKYWATQGDVPIVAAGIANITTVAGIASDVTTVSGVNAAVTNLSGISAAVSTVSGISSSVSTVSGVSSDVTTVAANIGSVTTVAGISGDVTSVAGISLDVATVAADGTDIGIVAGISSDITEIAGISTQITTVANGFDTGNLNFTGTATISSDLTVGGNLQVNGTTTTINSTTMDVDDLNITVASGAASAAASDGGGITIDGANIALAYDHSDSVFDINYNFRVSGDLSTLNSGGYINLFEASDSSGVFTKFADATSGKTTTDGFLIGLDSSQKAILRNYEATDMELGTSGSSRLRIGGSGNVLVETGNQVRLLGSSDSLYTAIARTTPTGANTATLQDKSGTIALEDGSGNLFLNDDTALLSPQSASTSSTATVAIATFAHASWKSAKAIISATQDLGGGVYNTQITEMLIAHNGSTASATEYGNVYTGSNPIATFDVDINLADVRVLVTPASVTSTTYKVILTLT